MTNLATLPTGERIGMEPHAMGGTESPRSGDRLSGGRLSGYRLGIRSHGAAGDRGAGGDRGGVCDGALRDGALRGGAVHGNAVRDGAVRDGALHSGAARDGNGVNAKPQPTLSTFHTAQISNYALGKLGEDIAAGYLSRIEGLEIIERNVRSTVGEIDLIAGSEEELVFVEVKTRRGATRGALSVNPRKLHRMRRTAGIWLANRSNYLPARFAVIEIDLPRTRGYGFLHYFPEVDSGAR